MNIYDVETVREEHIVIKSYLDDDKRIDGGSAYVCCTNAVPSSGSDDGGELLSKDALPNQVEVYMNGQAETLANKPMVEAVDDDKVKKEKRVKKIKNVNHKWNHMELDHYSASERLTHSTHGVSGANVTSLRIIYALL